MIYKLYCRMFQRELTICVSLIQRCGRGSLLLTHTGASGAPRSRCRSDLEQSEAELELSRANSPSFQPRDHPNPTHPDPDPPSAATELPRQASHCSISKRIFPPAPRRFPYSATATSTAPAPFPPSLSRKPLASVPSPHRQRANLKLIRIRSNW